MRNSLHVLLICSLVLASSPFWGAEPADACPVVTDTQYVSATSRSAPEPDMNPRSVSNIAPRDDCLKDGSTGGGGGCTTSCAPVWVPRTINGIATYEIDNPLSRFDEFRVDRSDADRIVTLQPLPYTADGGDILTPLQAITEGDITQAMLYFGMQDGAAIARELDEVLRDEPTLDGVRQQVLNLVNGEQYLAAARELLATATPANVTLLCGPDQNPVQLHWVVAIPVVVPCSTGTVQKEMPMVVRVNNTDPIEDQFLADQDSQFRMSNGQFRFAAGPSTDGSKLLGGFSLRRHALGAFTTTAKAWSIDVTFANLAHTKADTLAVTYRTGISGLVEASGTTFSPSDRLYYTYMGKLSRAYSTGALITNNTAGEYPAAFSLSVAGGTGTKDAPHESWQQRVAVLPGSAGWLDRWVGMMEYQEGHALALEVARTEAVWYRAQQQASSQGTRYYLALQRSTDQPADTPADKYEVKMTLFRGSTAVASLQNVGLPTLARYWFDTGEEAGDGIARIEASRDPSMAIKQGPDGNPIEARFRTVLITGHSGHILVSGTADYQGRVILQGSMTFDPINATEEPFVVQGGWGHDNHWSHFNVTNSTSSTSMSFVSVRHVDTPDIGSVWVAGRGTSATPPQFVYDNAIDRVDTAPSGLNRYVWAHSEAAALHTLSLCPVSTVTGECR